MKSVAQNIYICSCCKKFKSESKGKVSAHEKKCKKEKKLDDLFKKIPIEEILKRLKSEVLVEELLGRKKEEGIYLMIKAVESQGWKVEVKVPPMPPQQ